MHRVSHLVEALAFRLTQVASLVERAAFEKKMNLVARLDEVAIRKLLFRRRREHAAYVDRIERVDELERTSPQSLTGVDRHEITQDHDAGLVISLEHGLVDAAT